jgi:hypothetical protein
MISEKMNPEIRKAKETPDEVESLADGVAL